MLNFTHCHIRPPKHNLKKLKWFIIRFCSEVRVPGNSDKPQLVKLLDDGEVGLDIFRDLVKLDAYLAHIVEGPTE